MNQEDLELLREGLKKEKDGKVILVEPPTFAVRLLEETCARTGLDWKQRHVYLIERGKKWSVTLSIDGFRLIANNDAEYNGQAGPFWTMGPDKPWTDIPPDQAPYAAKVGVYRKGQAEPTWGVAKYSDYNAGSPMWRKFASTMVAKCAEMLALRKALPGKLGGLYGAEEMDQADVKPGAKLPDSARKSKSAESEPETHDSVEQFTKMIADAPTAEELKAVGQAIQKSSLGLETKVALSKVYGERKQKENWK